MKKLITAFALLLVFAFTGCAEIDQTERGVILNFGKVSETIDPGLHFYNVITEKVVRMPVKTQLETMRVGAGSKDMQEVTVGVNVNYHIDPMKVADVYGQYGKDVVVTILQPKMRETITGVTPQYAPEEMLQKREEIRLRMKNDLRAKLDSVKSHIIIDGFTIYEFKFDDKFNQAILDKQVAEQNALKEKNILKKVEYENEQKKIAARADSTAKVIAAKADSVAIAVKLKALKQQNSKEYITLQWIETWDGKLPNVVANDKVMPIVDMK
jgi:regulator of protease activity HflC (stomatin/prohibitin superfamily)